MMDELLILPCPICGAESSLVAEHELCGFNDSIFDGVAEYRGCEDCNYVWLASVSQDDLCEYYSKEAVYFASSHFDINAPGNIAKFKRYTDLVQSVPGDIGSVLDIGCGRGGFISWLKKNCPELSCFGVDLDLKSLPANRSGSPFFINGDISKLPFASSQFDVVTCFHVLEHVLDIDVFLAERARILKEGGHFVLEVPDASQYSVETPCKGFWVGVQEHVNHFSPQALQKVLENAGFAIRSIGQGVAESSDVDYPFIAIVAQKNAEACFPAEYSMDSVPAYVQDSLRHFKDIGANLSGLPHESIVFWGVSMMFMYILPYVTGKNINVCDASVFKQNQKIMGKTIISPEEAFKRYGNKDTCLVVSSLLNYEVIRKAALDLGWKSENITKIV
ncbi:class I SAM-dependent methyltransferase [Maridesulfovibrio sp.]|uniref:class I SAM-dependent methyltransferase n=1 Tax=unclassified Maridesulfovibrio TaxID=2794999 RepID=UPI003B00D74E